MIIKDAFKDITRRSIPEADGRVYGQAYMDSMSSMQIGEGSQVMRSDQSGLWLGAAEFVDAPFSVDMQGNVTATSLDLSAYLTKAGTSQSLTGDINLNDANIKLDGTNNRILINDGTSNRILIGKDTGGF